MDILKGKDLASFVTGLISEKHQTSSSSIDLTVSKVSRVAKGGSLDFGGSEEEASLTEEVKPVKRQDEDKYAWWTLSDGEYMIEFNERIDVPEGFLFLLKPHQRTLNAGGTHPTMIYAGGEKVEKIPLTVGKGGINIKENARISSLIGAKTVS